MLITFTLEPHLHPHEYHIFQSKSLFSCCLHRHIAGIDSNDIFIVALEVFLSKLYVLDVDFLPVQTDHSHRFGINLIEPSHKFTGIAGSKTRVECCSFVKKLYEFLSSSVSGIRLNKS
jgi:hypothetical protein